MTVLSGLKKIFIHSTKKISRHNPVKTEPKSNGRAKKRTHPQSSKKRNVWKNRKIQTNETGSITFSAREKMPPQSFTSTINRFPLNTRNGKNKIKFVKNAAKPKPKNHEKTESDITLKISSSDNKTVFLHFLSDSDTLKQAIKKSGVSLSLVHYLLKTDDDFRTAVDEVLNKKLEFAAIDTALGGNSSLLTLMLTNRMPDKYKPKNSYEEPTPYSRIIYVDAEESKLAKEKNKGRKI
jgi:hypothetical protein